MEEEPKLQSIPMQDFTATDSQSKHSAEEVVGEDVDYVREDIQSKVSKPLVSVHLRVQDPNSAPRSPSLTTTSLPLTVIVEPDCLYHSLIHVPLCP
jgi:hypothetical protein